ncbi:unnamed protein product [Adineta steineri]|uniref:Uncharacterized protein n=1 Tax=Adineta steineri TaxID=433720 RepID=A0A815PMH8_9BILA|nr:unnamed protein product [Adineta steineri]CAF1630658.1 unnamed protein product [Adineta steineri]
MDASIQNNLSKSLILMKEKLQLYILYDDFYYKKLFNALIELIQKYKLIDKNGQIIKLITNHSIDIEREQLSEEYPKLNSISKIIYIIGPRLGSILIDSNQFDDSVIIIQKSFSSSLILNKLPERQNLNPLVGPVIDLAGSLNNNKFLSYHIKLFDLQPSINIYKDNYRFKLQIPSSPFRSDQIWINASSIISSLENDQIKLRIHCIGVNFHDIVKVQRLYPYTDKFGLLEKD